MRKHSHLDRSFKTISLPLDDNKVRIKAIGQDGNEVALIEQKTVNLDISKDEYESSNPIFRVKAKLSMAVDGIKESEWVTFKTLKENELQEINQYRIRGVTKNNSVTDWVYSNIKTKENEDILFELIHDLLEILDTVKDDEIEYMFDSLVQDMFISYFQDDETHLERSYDLDNKRAIKLKEMKKLLKNKLQDDFRENVVSSFSYFSDLMRTYQILDRFEAENKDFLAYVLEAYLDDKLEKIIQEINYEAILQSDEELQALLREVYHFNIKRSVTQLFHEIKPAENFVTNITDIVKLFTEPEAFEELGYQAREEYYNLFSTLIKDIYLPLVSMVDLTALVEAEFEDEVSIEKEDYLVEYELTVGDDIFKNNFLRDILSMLFKEKDLEMDIFPIFSEIFIYPKLERKINLWLEYKPVEFIEYFLNVSENVEAHLKTLEKNNIHLINANINENHLHQNACKKINIRYLIKLHQNESINILNTTNRKEKQEMLVIHLVLKNIAELKKNFNYFDDVFQFILSDYVTSKKTKGDISYKESSSLLSEDSYKLLELLEFIFGQEWKHIGFKFHSEQVYLPNLYDDILQFMNDYLDIKLNPNCKDSYILKAKEDVRYFLGELNGKDVLGKFILGESTL